MMTSANTDPATRPARRPARDLIDAVVDNMRKNLEYLKYSTLAPSRYTVYVHPNEFARLEGIIPVLREQTLRALGEALQDLNRQSRLRRLVGRIRPTGVPEVQNAGAGWHVEFLPDPDGELNDGDLLIDSELVLPARPALGVGEHTRRIQTRHIDGHTSTREILQTREAAAPAHAATLAVLTYSDQSGPQTFNITKDAITIGRGGRTHPVDVRLSAPEDVSREHARIRREAATGEFFLTDLSSLGTTLNGRHVPKGSETPLPDSATIGLAGMISLVFKKHV